MNRSLWRYVGYALVGLIVIASLIPMPQLPGPDVPMQDKWLHLIAWGGLAGWFGQILSGSGARIRWFALLFATSGLIEVAPDSAAFSGRGLGRPAGKRSGAEHRDTDFRRCYASESDPFSRCLIDRIRSACSASPRLAPVSPRSSND